MINFDELKVDNNKIKGKIQFHGKTDRQTNTLTHFWTFEATFSQLKISSILDQHSQRTVASTSARCPPPPSSLMTSGSVSGVR